MAKIINFKQAMMQRDTDEDALATLDYSIAKIAMSTDLSNIASVWQENGSFLNEHSYIVGIFPNNSFKIFFYNKPFNKNAFIKTFRHLSPVPTEMKMLELKQWFQKIYRQMQPPSVAANFMKFILDWHKHLKPCFEEEKMIISDYEDKVTFCKAVVALTTHTKSAYLIPRCTPPEEMTDV